MIKTTQTLIDSFARRICYLRISVTDHCNYRCHYCRPEEDKTNTARTELLTYEEITRLVNIFAQMGVYKVRLTGGEPLLRNNIAQLVQMINQNKDITDISLSTNAHLLSSMAGKLHQAGVARVNISIDSLQDERFKQITRGGDLSKVLAGIDGAIACGMTPVKLNMVVMRGVNDDEVETMVDYAINKGVDIRFIETMPVGQPGILALSQHYTQAQIQARLTQHLPNRLSPVIALPSAGPADNFNIIGTQSQVGVISAVSNHFCATCNRVRLSSKGDLILCLGQENKLPLREMMRQGSDDMSIKQAIITAIGLKPQKHNFVEDVNHIEGRNMVEMGG